MCAIHWLKVKIGYKMFLFIKVIFLQLYQLKSDTNDKWMTMDQSCQTCKGFIALVW